jgi:hypothetical protein
MPQIHAVLPLMGPVATELTEPVTGVALPLKCEFAIQMPPIHAVLPVMVPIVTELSEGVPSSVVTLTPEFCAEGPTGVTPSHLPNHNRSPEARIMMLTHGLGERGSPIGMSPPLVAKMLE